MNDGGHFGHVPDSTTDWISAGKIVAAVIGYSAFLLGGLFLIFVVIVFAFIRYRAKAKAKRKREEELYYAGEDEEEISDISTAEPMEP